MNKNSIKIAYYVAIIAIILIVGSEYYYIQHKGFIVFHNTTKGYNLYNNSSLSNATPILINYAKANISSSKYLGNITMQNEGISVSYSINNFSFSTYSYILNNSNSNNTFFSPFSLYVTLAMLDNGAAGSTYSQISKALDISNGLQNTNIGILYLINEISSQNPSLCTLNISNGAWMQNNYSIKKSFIENLSYYNADVYLVNFINNKNTYKYINNWVLNKTNQKIKELFNSPFLNNTRLVLVNTIYFKGNWSISFPKNNTKLGNFYLTNGSILKVPLMNNTFDRTAYYYNNTVFQALMLDYQGGNISMIILLPNNGTSLRYALISLKQIGIANLIKNMSNNFIIEAHLPKFNFTKHVDLISLLNDLGIKNAFSKTNANFSKIANITQTNRLYVSDIVQGAYIRVNETGTEAAAATGVTVGVATVPAPPPFVVFNANRSFLFLIIDKHTGIILFEGSVNNPTK
ncbi:MAG: serpin family protein [Candidatus Micrarchaeia archaeon]